MALPLLLIGAAVLGGFGVKKGYEAHSDRQQADELNRRAQALFDGAKGGLVAARAACTHELEALGRRKFDIWDRQLGRFVALFEQLRHVQLDGSADVARLGGAAFTEGELARMKRLSGFAREAVGGGAAALGSGALVGMASYGGAMMFATASTGTAIGSLTGVAATNATLAWFGGGSLAAGGMGMAGGMAVLGGVVAGPVLAVGGMVLAAKARKNLAEAQGNHAKAQAAASEMRAATALVEGIRKVAVQVGQVTLALDQRTTRVLDGLAEVLDRCGTDYRRFGAEDRRRVHRAVVFAQGLKALLEAPLLTESGGLAPAVGPALGAGRALVGLADGA